MMIDLKAKFYSLFHRCSPYEQLIIEAVYGELAEGDHARLEEHCSQCIRCRESYAELIKFTGQLDRVKREAPPLTVQEEAELFSTIVDGVRDHTWADEFAQVWKGKGLFKTVGALAGLLLIIVIGNAIYKGSNNAKEQYASLLPEGGWMTFLPDNVKNPIEKERRELLSLILQNTHPTVTGQALLRLANLEFNEAERYDEAYRLFTQLRERYPRIFASSPDAIYKFTLLKETANDDFKPLYILNNTKKSGEYSVKQLERIISQYPGTLVAQLAVHQLMDCISTAVDHSPDKQISNLELAKQYLTEPTAIAQINYMIGNIYLKQVRDWDRARFYFETVTEQTNSHRLYPKAQNALVKLVLESGH